MASDKRMRRSPQQARGQRRVTKILDAAAEVFAEIGYEESTTNAIAIRANTSIGSLYQFFPNKLAILNSLAHRFRTALDGQLNGAYEHSPARLQVLLSRFIDQVIEYYVENPAFQPMFYASQSSRELSTVAHETGAILVERVSGMFLQAVPALSQQQSTFYATVVVFILRSLIPLSQSKDEPQHELIIPQLKRMVFAYLASIEAFAGQSFAFED